MSLIADPSRPAGGRVGAILSMAWGAILLGGHLLRRTACAPLPSVSLRDRLAAIPAEAPLAAPLSIRWSDRHVPFVEARSEADLAVGFGIVHAHLRGSQLELMRRAATGRLSEILGPAAVEIDRLLLLLDFPRAADASLALMPDATRAFVRGFADGISAVAAVGRPPPDLALLGVALEPWSERDVFAVSRLASTDYTWKVWRTIRHLRDHPEWPEIWKALLGRAGAAGEDVPANSRDLPATVATAFARNGSNAIAVAPERSVTGAAMLACDPHLPIMTPGIWFAVGLSAPTMTAVGLAIPGLPILGVGRNAATAWGGTNLHAASSELVDVAAGDEPIETRSALLPVRWSRRPRRVVLRESRFGPVVSDTPAFRFAGDRPVALRWLGHRPSDEFTPFLDMARARRWDDFRDACHRYALPGLNMLYAGADGRIGQKVAARLPRRPLGMPADLVLSPADADARWATFVGSADLPETVDPPGGILASANDEPVGSATPVGFFFSAPDRVERLKALSGADGRIGPEDLGRFQRDVFQATSLAIRDRLAAALADGARAEPPDPVLAAMAAWDGHYGDDSKGALAFELVVAALVPRLERRVRERVVRRHWQPLSRVEALVASADPATLRGETRASLRAARNAWLRFRTWGSLHRVRLAHPLSRLPWLARRCRPVEFAGAGSNETLMKSQHAFTMRRHAAHFGQNARFVADLSDVDATGFVLLGGQDGWVGSDTLADQAEDFRAGRTLPLPLSPAAVRDAFPHATPVVPVARGASGRPAAAAHGAGAARVAGAVVRSAP